MSNTQEPARSAVKVGCVLTKIYCRAENDGGAAGIFNHHSEIYFYGGLIDTSGEEFMTFHSGKVYEDIDDGDTIHINKILLHPDHPAATERMLPISMVVMEEDREKFFEVLMALQAFLDKYSGTWAGFLMDLGLSLGPSSIGFVLDVASILYEADKHGPGLDFNKDDLVAKGGWEFYEDPDLVDGADAHGICYDVKDGDRRNFLFTCTYNPEQMPRPYCYEIVTSVGEADQHGLYRVHLQVGTLEYLKEKCPDVDFSA